MKSITIHNLDDVVDKKIRERAASQGISLNKTIKNLSKKAPGKTQGKETDHSEDFLDLFGTWFKEEPVNFNKSTGDFEKIDPGDWK